MKKLIFVIVLVVAVGANAVPVHRMPVVKIQPNGDTLHLFLTGDEFYHRLHDADNYTIVQHPQTGYWVYANVERQDEEHWNVVATEYAVGSVNPQTIGIEPAIGADRSTWRKCQQRYTVPEEAAVHRAKTSGRNHGTLNNIVIFIRFADDDEITTPFSDINAMFNDSTEASISMYSYFRNVSYGKISIPTYFFPQPSGNLVVSYCDSLPRACFRPYNAITNPMGYTNNARAQVEQDLLARAVRYINANCAVPTTINFDIDNDGCIDNVCFIIKGENDGWNDLLWPHKWSLYADEVYINGKRVYDFNFQLEGSGPHYFSSSTFCHEMFHTLGAPDLYRYENATDVSGTGSWDIMCSNTTPPQHMGAYMKFKYGNWLDSVPEITGAGTYTLHSLGDGNGYNCCYRLATDDPHQWYLFEYRDNTERFEETLPGKGLLIYRIDDRFDGNAEYDGTTHFDEVYLFRPGGYNDQVNGHVAQAYFSGATSRNEFNRYTDPFPWLTGNIIDTTLYISDISVPGEVISFTVSSVQSCHKPRQLRVTDVAMEEAMLTWTDNAERSLVQWKEDGAETHSETIVDADEYHLTGLDANTCYKWRVRGICGEGDSSFFSDWASFTTTECPIPNVAESANSDTTSTTTPICTFMGYNYTQMLFKAEELIGAMNISRVSFNYASNGSLEGKDNCIFYIGHTNKSSFSGGGANFVEFNTLKKVYEGPLVCYNGWNEIILDSTFHYDGTSNLVLAVLDNGGTSDQAQSRFYCTNTPGRATTLYTLGYETLDPANFGSGTYKFTHNYRCDIRFTGCGGNEGIAPTDRAADPVVTVGRRTVSVTDPLRRDAVIYDVMGRRLKSSTGADRSEFRVPCPGVYLLSIEGLPTRKVVVM